MTCPACGGTDAEDGPWCVCWQRTEAVLRVLDLCDDAPELPPSHDIGGEG